MGTIGTVRTYEPVKIKFGIEQAFCQIDTRTGEVVPHEKETETNIIIETAMVIRGLEQGFLVSGKIHKAKFGKEKLAKKVKAALVTGLRGRNVWDFFRTTEITVTEEDPELDAYEAGGEIDDIVAPELEKQATAGNEAANQWREAIKEMGDVISWRNAIEMQITG